MNTMNVASPILPALDACETPLAPKMAALVDIVLPKDPIVPWIPAISFDDTEPPTRRMRSETVRNTAETMITFAPCWGGR